MISARMTQAVRRGYWKVLGLMPLLVLTGCQTRAGTGAAVGGGAGALVGNGLAKAMGGSRTAGTAIGGIVGAVAGAAIGDGYDQAERKGEARGQAMATAQQNIARAPTIEEIVQMSQTRVPENVIIDQIRTTRATYQLNSQDIVRMSQAGVPMTVIREMQATSIGTPPRVYTAQPVQVVQPVAVVEPAPVLVAPPPRPVVGASFNYHYHKRGK